LSSLRVLSIAHNAVAGSNRRRAEALAQLPDVEVELLTPRWWNEEGRRIDVASSAHWRVGRSLFTGNGTRYLYMTGLLEAVRAFRPDVIDLFEEPFSLVALQTLIARNLLASKAALVFYSAVNVHREWRWPYRAIERLVLRGADGAHAPNEDVPRILRAKGFSEDKAVEVIPLGVDVDRFASAAPIDLRDIPRPRVGFVGRLEAVKGLDVLLDGFQSLTTPASLVIVGDGSERERIRARAGDNVHVLPPVAYEQMPALLKSLDLLVLPSVTIPPLHREQFGRVLAEAMAAGVPVIGSASGAIPEVIGDAGLIVREQDSAVLAQAIDRVLGDPDLRQALIVYGKQRAQRRFGWPVVADRTAQLFRAALAHRRQATARLQAVGA
jgi:glycosyltransferase involved in cell wall biosynthesis